MSDRNFRVEQHFIDETVSSLDRAIHLCASVGEFELHYDLLRARLGLSLLGFTLPHTETNEKLGSKSPINRMMEKKRGTVSRPPRKRNICD